MQKQLMLLKMEMKILKTVFTLICVFVVTTLFLPAPSFAEIPKLINYQGKLTDPEGKPVSDGSYSVTFKIYEQEAGGSPFWYETQSVTTQKGIFSTQIGATKDLNLPFDKPYYLGIQVGSDAEMTPRQSLSSAAYAFRAKTAGQAEEAANSQKLGNIALSQILDRSNHTGKIQISDLSDDLLDLIIGKSLFTKISSVTTTRYQWTKVAEISFRQVYEKEIHISIEISVRNTSENQPTHGIMLSFRLNGQEFAGPRLYGNSDNSFKTWNLDYNILCPVGNANKVEIWASHDTGGSQGQVGGGTIMIEL